MAYRHHLPPSKKYRDLPIREGNFDGIRIRLLNAAWNALHRWGGAPRTSAGSC